MSSSNSNDILEDFLDVDQPIPGQNFCCLSFISPENVLRNKELYIMKDFLKEVLKDEKIRNETDPDSIDFSKIQDWYANYRINNEKRITSEYDEENDFKTSTRGVKVRGVYDSVNEAKVRAKVLQRKDPNFHVFVGQIGYWLPWDPSADNIEDQEYQEGQLNDLMKKYKENKESKDVFYDEQVTERKKDAIRKNLEKKKELEKQKKEEEPKADAEAEAKDNAEAEGKDTSDAEAKDKADKSQSEADNSVELNEDGQSKEAIEKIKTLRNIIDAKEDIATQKSDDTTNDTQADSVLDSEVPTEENNSQTESKDSKDSNENLNKIIDEIF